MPSQPRRSERPPHPPRPFPVTVVVLTAIVLANAIVDPVAAVVPTVAWGSYTPDTTVTGASPRLVSVGDVAAFTVSFRNDDPETLGRLTLAALDPGSPVPSPIRGLDEVEPSRPGCVEPPATRTLDCTFRDVRPGEVVTVRVGFRVAGPNAAGTPCPIGTTLDAPASPATRWGDVCVAFVWSTADPSTDAARAAAGEWIWRDGVATAAGPDFVGRFVLREGERTLTTAPLDLPGEGAGGGGAQRTILALTATGQEASVADPGTADEARAIGAGVAGDAVTGDGLATGADAGALACVDPALDCRTIDRRAIGGWSEVRVNGWIGRQPGGVPFTVTIVVDRGPGSPRLDPARVAVYHAWVDADGSARDESIDGACAAGSPPCLERVRVEGRLLTVAITTLQDGRFRLYAP